MSMVRVHAELFSSSAKISFFGGFYVLTREAIYIITEQDFILIKTTFQKAAFPHINQGEWRDRKSDGWR